MFENMTTVQNNLNIPFSYYFYEGSSTSPGCEEYVDFYIVDYVFYISNVVLEFF